MLCKLHPLLACLRDTSYGRRCAPTTCNTTAPKRASVGQFQWLLMRLQQNQSRQPPWFLGELALFLSCTRKSASVHSMIAIPPRAGRSARPLTGTGPVAKRAAAAQPPSRYCRKPQDQAAAAGCREANRDSEADEAVGCHAAAIGFDGLPLPPDIGQRPPRRQESWLAIAPVTQEPLR